jgi:hypothetical protein
MLMTARLFWVVCVASGKQCKHCMGEKKKEWQLVVSFHMPVFEQPLYHLCVMRGGGDHQFIETRRIPR